MAFVLNFLLKKPSSKKGYVSKAGSEALNDDDLKEKFINFSCWDFAGQEVYYATHSFFLSQRAIYILVFNLLEPEETNQIEYWLQSINSRTENSPIIMVGTHAEDKRCTQEYIKLYFEKIMEKYGQRFRNHIVSMHAISNIEKVPLPSPPSPPPSYKIQLPLTQFTFLRILVFPT